MGNCCGGDDTGNISVGGPGTNKGQGAGATEGAQYIDGDIFDYTNDRVKEILEKNGEYDAGAFKDSSAKLEEREIASLENNAKYKGQWEKNKNERHGLGIQVWSDGSMYQGHWKNDKANGKGRLIHADGDIYEAEWRDDKAHGQGVYKHTDGAEYNGDWKEDKQDGHGVETWPDGAKYEGDYVDGKKHGKGCLLYTSDAADE